ncbi:MAG: NAD(P)/FAD-dependent oxidoreductase [Planctomycetota bacterium]
MSLNHCEVAIVGAGAAGLFAAIFAGRTTSGGVVAFDGAKRLGAKILIAGGGRCNVTHDVVRPEDFSGDTTRGATRNAVKKVLRSFTVEDTIDFFRGRGVELKREETGKLFPTTDRARTVLEALVGACREAGAVLRTEHRVTGVERRDDGAFEVTTSQGVFVARRVVLCTGGLALPKTGSDGFGYAIARSLGHTVTPTWPALVPLVLPPEVDGRGHWLTGLKGVATDAELTLADAASGKVARRQAGAVLFTHFGVSGPAVMDLSRHFGGDWADGRWRLTANLRPGETSATLDAELLERARTQPGRTVSQVVREWLPERLAVAAVEHGAEVDPATPLAQLPKGDRRRLVQTLTALPLPVSADRGYEYAEVTAGGVPLEEVNLSTMASRVCPGLYLAGEVLDVDGRIGGYNFQWAWCTGRLAGLGAGKAD